MDGQAYPGRVAVSTGDLLAAALDYVERGWPVFPCRPGDKVPLAELAPHGLKEATCDPDVVRAWWECCPGANIGIATGHAFDALDVDGPDALALLELAGDADGDDVEGPTVETPRGWHCYVAPTGMGNAVDLVAGVDWRGLGGYVVAPPSRRPTGRYSWIVGGLEDQGPDTELVAPPAWLARLHPARRAARAPRPRGPAGNVAATNYGRAALNAELDKLSHAVQGTRNDRLNAAAHALGRLVAGCQLDGPDVAGELLRVALSIGLPETEAVRTIASGLGAGVNDPRRPRAR